MSKHQIFLSAPHQNQSEKNFVNQVLESNWLAPNGHFNHQFTKSLQQHLNTNVLLTNSGTSAIQLALNQIGVQKNDYVLCSTFTFAASAFPILYGGAIPVFIDVELDTWNISPTYIQQAIKSLQERNIQPKALIATHSYGVAAKVKEIQAICATNSLPWIEDAAEALGASYQNQALGTFANAGILSFNANKIITSTAGGALLSPNQHWIEQAKLQANQSKQPNLPHYEHQGIGYNFAMSNLCAAVGYAQMQNLQERVHKRRAIFDFYCDILQNKYNQIDYPKEVVHSKSNRWLSVFKLPNLLNHKIHQIFKENNIETRLLWKPMHLQKAFKDALYFGNHESEELFNHGIALPSGSGLSNHELEKIQQLIHHLSD